MNGEAKEFYAWSAAWAALAKMLHEAHDIMVSRQLPIAHLVRAQNAMRAALTVAEQLEAAGRACENASAANDNAGGSS